MIRLVGKFQAKVGMTYFVFHNFILEVTGSYVWLPQKYNPSAYLTHKMKVISHNVQTQSAMSTKSPYGGNCLCHWVSMATYCYHTMEKDMFNVLCDHILCALSDTFYQNFIYFHFLQGPYSGYHDCKNIKHLIIYKWSWWKCGQKLKTINIVKGLISPFLVHVFIIWKDLSS